MLLVTFAFYCLQIFRMKIIFNQLLYTEGYCCLVTDFKVCGAGKSTLFNVKCDK